jgi:type III secretory pathway component EscU
MIDSTGKFLAIILSAIASPLVLFAIFQQMFRYLRNKRKRELERIWRMTHDEVEEEAAVGEGS